MKQQPSSKGLLSLTSDQIEEALAKGFMRFVNSTARPYRRTSVNIPEALLQKHELGPKKRVSKHHSETDKKGKKAGSARKKTKKGRTPIRSQTGHDHDRNHHKY
jgi:hypothetical protein